MSDGSVGDGSDGGNGDGSHERTQRRR